MSIISQLRERVRIEQPVVVADGFGGQTTSWSTLETVFAQVDPLNLGQGERSIAEQRTATAGYRVRIRMRSDLNASMRLVWKTHVLTIHSLHEQGETLSILTYEEQL